VSSAKLYVGNLSYETSEASIRTAFEAHGEVTSVNLITDRDSGRPKGFGFVEMGTPEEAQTARSTLPRNKRLVRLVRAAAIAAAIAGKSRATSALMKRRSSGRRFHFNPLASRADLFEFHLDDVLDPRLGLHAGHHGVHGTVVTRTDHGVRRRRSPPPAAEVPPVRGHVGSVVSSSGSPYYYCSRRMVDNGIP
jgi:RNA recognition motif-containing protein